MMGEVEEVKVEVVNSWSAPRSLSTCLMYSFAQRDDTEVVDEPFYALMLQVPGAGIERPYREDLISKMDIDGSKVVNDIIFGPGKKKYRYCKNIANQRVPGTADLMKKGKHFILLRNPLYVLQSYDKVAPPSFLELGYSDLVSIYSELCDLGKPPPIVESSELQRDPEGVLRQLCEDLGIPFQNSMLKWEAGPNPADGIWAPMWYKSLHKTTGFVPPKKHRKVFPLALYDMLEQCLPFYNFLMRQKSRQMFPLGRPISSEPEPPIHVNPNKLFVWVGNEILPLDFAKVSAIDTVFPATGAVWEGLQIFNKKVLKLDEHVDRLFKSAAAKEFNHVRTCEEIEDAIFTTLITNGMYHNAQIKVLLMPRKNMASGVCTGHDQYPYENTLIVLPEWKPLMNDSGKGVSLVTAPKACVFNAVEGNKTAAAEIIILDKEGFVSEATDFDLFIVKKGRVLVPHVDHYVSSIAREMVISLVIAEGLSIEECRISLLEIHNADEAWMTGAMDEMKPVVEIDGRKIGEGNVGLITCKILSGFKNLMEQSGVSIPAE